MSYSADPFDDGSAWQSVPSQGPRPAQPTTAPLREETIVDATAAEVVSVSSLTEQPSAPPIPSVDHSSSPTAPRHPHQPPPIPHQQLSQPEDLPPSYEATITKDIPQLHDNYDHLRGPARGLDVKFRIPMDSYSGSGTGGSGSGSGSSAVAGSSSGSGSGTGGVGGSSSPTYGAIAQPSAPDLHSQTSGGGGRLVGQSALGAEEDDLEHSRDVDRLMGNDGQTTTAHHDDDDSQVGLHEDDKDSYWAAAGDVRNWITWLYMLFVLLPWSLFCFGWTLAWLIVASCCMFFPPVGYFFMIFAITSWRALARVDIEMSRVLVSRSVREKYPMRPYRVFVELPPQRSRSMGDILRRRKRARNLWDKGWIHLKLNIKDRHTVSSMFYFLFWKLFFALPIFIVVVLFTCLSVPLMICFLPTLMKCCRAFANGQYRWAVNWLSKKPSATGGIVLP